MIKIRLNQISEVERGVGVFELFKDVGGVLVNIECKRESLISENVLGSNGIEVEKKH